MKKNKSIGVCFAGGVNKDKQKDSLAWDTLLRLDKVILLFKMGFIEKIICTGGIFQENQKIPASKLMKNYLIKHNVPSSKINTEEKSVDTIENIKFTLEILKNQGLLNNITSKEQLRLVLISENEHLKRILISFTAFLKKEKLSHLIPLILEPVYCFIDEKKSYTEKKILSAIKKDPFGQSKEFQKIRQQRKKFAQQ